jgi:RES domain-containing protein
MATIIWRIVSLRYAGRVESGQPVARFDGTALMRVGGRWHPKGLRIEYAAMSKSQALLEVIANSAGLRSAAVFNHFRALPILVPNSVAWKRVELTDLTDKWRDDLDETQALGKKLLSEFAIVIVPSFQVYGEHTALISPLHKDFTRLIPVPLESIFWNDDPFHRSVITTVDNHRDVFLCHASDAHAAEYVDRILKGEKLAEARVGKGITGRRSQPDPGFRRDRRTLGSPTSIFSRTSMPTLAFAE